MAVWSLVEGSVAADSDIVTFGIAHGITGLAAGYSAVGNAIVALLVGTTATVSVPTNLGPTSVNARFSRSSSASVTVRALVATGVRGVQFVA